MPIYVFQCTDCKEKFEKLVKMGTDKTVCPKCESFSEKVFDESSLFTAHGLPNGHIGMR